MSAIPNFPPGVEKAIAAGVDRFGNYVYNKAWAFGEQYVGGKIDQGLESIGNKVDTYFSGGSPYARHMSRPAFDSNGYTPAPEFQHWAQQNNNSQATKRSRSVNGQNTGVSLSDGVACPAMFNPGRGAELGLVNKLIDAPLVFKTGEHPGPSRPKDAFSTQLELYRGIRLNHSFAFKGLVPVQASTTDALVNRGYVHNVFRHYNYAAIGTGSGPYDFYGPGTGQWNNTLGPDGALIRTNPRVSTVDAAALVAAGLNATLTSPYRTPGNGAIMYSRMTQQFMENTGWAAHPYKYVQPEGNAGTQLTTTTPVIYSNAAFEHVRYPKSYPAQQPYTPGTVVDARVHGSPYYYRSQFGKGKVQYDFSNDGTCPVVIDIVINKVKQGKTWKTGPANSLHGNPGLLDEIYKNGYIRMTTCNRNLMASGGLQGQPPVSTDCLTNARCEFMPKAALKYSQNYGTDQGSSTDSYDQPFKQIARDQFIISAGASRAWRFEMPALDYDPRRYGNTSIALDGSTTAIVVEDIVCDFTYIVSIAYSAVSTPVFEVPTGASAKNAIIDRRPGDCNISVTGNYEEFCHPVYLTKDSLIDAYINGALDVPYYGTAPAAGVIANLEIANLNQVTRGSTPGSALISVGAINTLPGA